MSENNQLDIFLGKPTQKGQVGKNGRFRHQKSAVQIKSLAYFIYVLK